MMVTVAPGTACPWGSVTLPEIEPVVVWAEAERGSANVATRAAGTTSARRRPGRAVNMAPPDSGTPSVAAVQARAASGRTSIILPGVRACGGYIAAGQKSTILRLLYRYRDWLRYILGL